MHHPPFDRRGFLAALLGNTLWFEALTPSSAAASRKDPPLVTREQNGAFKFAQPGSPAVRVTFLSPTVLRVTILTQAPSTPRLPDYVRVKATSSYPPVDVEIYAEDDEVTFETAGAIFNVSASNDVITMDLQTPDKVLIDEWEIDAGELIARIELKVGERIYGFGDKRAALDQRGRKVDILNRDAFASESNDSYKNIPFYMSSAGYGLFFYNYHRSNFDIGASVRNQLRITATGGSLDF